MIRELRQSHGRLALALLVLPPAVLAAALMSRAPAPPPVDLGATGPDAGPALALAPEFPLHVTAAWDSAAARLQFAARAVAPLHAPDPLLYWTPSEPGDGNALPPGSRFIAPIGAGRTVEMLISDAGIRRRGRLVLLTHPDRRIAATTPVLLPLPEKR